jgi:hypothetical protein
MITVEENKPKPPPPPPIYYIIRSTEGHGTWNLSEKEARELFEGLKQYFD